MCCRRVFIRLSVTSRHCTKTADRRIRKQRRTMVQGLFKFSDAKNLGEIPTALPPTGRQIEVGEVKMAIFDQYLAISQKRYKIGT